MTQVAKALHSFFSAFGLPAYVEGTVPDDALLPYITYDLVQPDWRANTSLSARVWYHDSSFEAIANKVDEIDLASRQGVSIETESGAVYLWPDDNWAQFQSMDEPDLKCAYLSFVMQANTD